jgi:hypothetical protein
VRGAGPSVGQIDLPARLEGGEQRGDPAPDVTLITARSSGANTPTTLAVSMAPLTSDVTCTVETLPTTCALVTMSPCPSKVKWD